MSSRPAIFISAVGCELKRARQLVAKTLTTLGYHSEWLDISATEANDLPATLRRRIESCSGVVQLVGKCYGPEPPNVDQEFGRVSYSQYEALYAAKIGKKVWYLFLDERFPTDVQEKEDEEKEKLQSEYRARIKAAAHLYLPLDSVEGLEASVLKLRDDLTLLRRGVRRWGALVAALFIVGLALTIWLARSQQHSNQELQVLREKLDKLQQGVNAFVQVQDKVRGELPEQKPEETERRTYEVLANELGVDATMLKNELPRFAQELKKAPNATTYERANAAYVAKDYAEAESLALAAADEALGATPPKTDEAIKAFELSAWAAEKQIEYADALKHLREAEKLTDRAGDAIAWARLQFAIAYVLNEQGQYAQAERVFREVLTERQRALGPENPDTLATRDGIALALYKQGKYSEAETEDRELLELRQKVLGPEHPETLKTRNNVAITLYDQGRYPEAEAEFRAILKLRQKVLGPEHLDTAKTLSNLANTLSTEGKYAESETYDRLAIKLREKVLGPEHPDTLNTRHNLALTLDWEGKYPEAEAEYRSVIKLKEKVLGPEHPDTLRSRSNLAANLYLQGKYAEAEAEDRDLVKLQEKVFGPEHPATLGSRTTLGLVLDVEGKYAEAETEDREVIKLKEKVLGPEHPDTLGTCTNLAEALDHQGKCLEAEAEDRRVISIEQRVLGAEHPYTLDTRNGLAEVLEHEGKYVEAEKEGRAVLELKEKVLGEKHADTLRICFDLAVCLRAEGKAEEARRFAQRAVDGARDVLGAEHPDTKRYEKLRQELLASAG